MARPQSTPPRHAVATVPPHLTVVRGAITFRAVQTNPVKSRLGFVGRASSRRAGRRCARALDSFILILPATVLVASCAAPSRSPTPSVESAWEQRESQPPRTAPSYQERASVSVNRGAHLSTADGEVIATVNGEEILRSRFVDLLIRSRGVAVLEQLIGVEAASHEARRRGLRVSESDIEREMDLSLRRMIDPLWSVSPDAFDRPAAERVLEATLAQRNMSREEFELLTLRNAILRQLAAAEVEITHGDLEREYAVQYGPKVEVRHIQVAGAAEAARIRELIDRGEDFSALAAKFSANSANAGDGGLLTPFSLADETIPDSFRTAIAGLQPGELSGVVRVGQWHHLIRLERRLPPESVFFAEVRDRLEASLRDRLAESRMYRHFERLFRESTIAIHDPLLAEEFDKVHEARVR
jgi:hypothetical protein